MKAPDKIYIQEGAILRTEKTYDNDICYIRKDALLEFIEKQSQNWSSDSITGQGVKTGLFMIKDKLESL